MGGMAQAHSAQYLAYLASPEWAAFRQTYYRTHARACAACEAPTFVDLHHVTYERLGRESVGDVVPLCRRCHDDVHNAHKQAGGKLAAVTWRIITARRRRVGTRRIVPPWAVGGMPDKPKRLPRSATRARQGQHRSKPLRGKARLLHLNAILEARQRLLREGVQSGPYTAGRPRA